MKRRKLRWSLLAAGYLLLSGGSAWAQRPAHYMPVRPPISPYLWYSAINTTGLPNYYTYVRPSVQFQSFLERRTAEMGRAETRVRIDEGRVNAIVERQLALRETTGVGAPSTPGTFMELSHYYSSQPIRRR